MKRISIGISLLLFIVSTAYSNNHSGSTDEVVQRCDHLYEQGEEVPSDCYIPFIHDRMQLKLPTSPRICKEVAGVEVCSERGMCRIEDSCVSCGSSFGGYLPCLTTCVNNPAANTYGCSSEFL